MATKVEILRGTKVEIVKGPSLSDLLSALTNDSEIQEVEFTTETFFPEKGRHLVVVSIDGLLTGEARITDIHELDYTYYNVMGYIIKVNRLSLRLRITNNDDSLPRFDALFRVQNRTGILTISPFTVGDWVQLRDHNDKERVGYVREVDQADGRLTIVDPSSSEGPWTRYSGSVQAVKDPSS